MWFDYVFCSWVAKTPVGALVKVTNSTNNDDDGKMRDHEYGSQTISGRSFSRF